MLTTQLIVFTYFAAFLKLLKNNFQPGTIILFDEFYGFPNWEKYEYKAFKEEIEENKLPRQSLTAIQIAH